MIRLLTGNCSALSRNRCVPISKWSNWIAPSTTPHSPRHAPTHCFAISPGGVFLLGRPVEGPRIIDASPRSKSIPPIFPLKIDPTGVPTGCLMAIRGRCSGAGRAELSLSKMFEEQVVDACGVLDGNSMRRVCDFDIARPWDSCGESTAELRSGDAIVECTDDESRKAS